MAAKGRGNRMIVVWATGRRRRDTGFVIPLHWLRENDLMIT